MAESGVHLDQDRFSCAVCLDLLKDPVTIPCGHSYCMDCIKGCWDQEDQVGVYSCPQCRQTFTSRPVLGRNTMLAEVVKKLKKTELQDAPPEHCYAGPGDVVCDVCTGRKLRAIKSCLVCLASFCEIHLQPHYDSVPLRRHKLTDATRNLQDNVCSQHDKLLEVYCRTDQQCICYLCVMDEHRGHDTVSLPAGRTEEQKYLKVKQNEFQEGIQQREKKVQELREAVDSLTRSAQAALEDTDSIFTQMIRSLEKRRSELKDVIRAQEKAALSQAEGLLEQLEQEIAELKRRDAEMEQLSHTEDHIHFLQSFQSLCVPPGPVHLPTITVNPHCSFGGVKKALSDLKVQLEEACKNTFTEISHTVKEVHIVDTSKPDPLRKVQVIPEPRTREEFLYYACQLTLDTNTANKNLRLSERNTVVTHEKRLQSYPDHPERFDWWSQVLCTEGLSGCYYWELQWGGDVEVYIAVSYRGINRKGRGIDCIFGYNNKSWSLICSPSSYSFYHNNVKIQVSGSSSSTIGVYLDHRAGNLCFYSVSRNTMTLLHRVQTTFTEPLYPGFWVFATGSKVKLCSLR
ncbi:tripartite motif-containing protein 16-like isoform X1 [Scleropages formosus]|uniref:tripartite motif-containing protein 16-like isoform X1 n=1 Tax=Scleropages formosus TaxID=113540 RepID=UPI0010FAC3DA|nr:tripartite motif-containing protein 16-like isoform X1 [Scleropages formosus]